MSSDETIYVFATNGPVLLAADRDNTSSVPVYLDGDPVTPDAVSYVLKDRVGQTVTVGTPDPGPPPSVALAAADLPATLGLGEGYSEYWTITLDGVPRQFRRDVVLSLFELHPPMAEIDIVEGEYPTLLDDLAGYSDTLQPYMNSAWRELVRTLVRRGDFVDIIVEPSDVYEWFRHLTLERVFRMLFRAQENQRNKDLWEFHAQQAKIERDGCRFKTDRARRGIADSLAREPAARSVHVNLPPRRRTYNPQW